jgi:hypothetical protein
MNQILKKTCFVIMPFSDTKSHSEQYWENHFEYFLKPFIENKLNMNARRSKPLVGDILNKIITDLTNSDLVIADITDFNPNVFWELGVRHSFIKSGTIIIAEKGIDPPFDLGKVSTHHYFDHSINPDTTNFFKELESAVTSCNTKINQGDSPVFLAISGRGTMYELIIQEETIRKIDAILKELTNNLENLEIIFDNINKYKEMMNDITKKHEPKVIFLTITALENLIVNQYLTEPASFYQKCRMCMNWTIAIKDYETLRKGPEILTQENWFNLNIPVLQQLIEDLILELKLINGKWIEIK